MNLHGTRTGRRGIVGQLSPRKGESSHWGLSPCISGLRNYRYLTPYANVFSFPVPYTILPLFLASAFLEKYSGNKRQRRGEQSRAQCVFCNEMSAGGACLGRLVTHNCWRSLRENYREGTQTQRHSSSSSNYCNGLVPNHTPRVLPWPTTAHTTLCYACEEEAGGRRACVHA
jgi:hypothetical protein